MAALCEQDSLSTEELRTGDDYLALGVYTFWLISSHNYKLFGFKIFRF
jgi:hypothetical protein